MAHGAGPPGSASDTPDNVLVDYFGQVASLGAVYNEAQMMGTRLAALACFVTARSVYVHWRWNAYPQIRSSIVRILLLVPVYAVDASLGLQYTRLAVPRQMLRQAYEAYALLSFMRLMFVTLGDWATPWRGDSRDARYKLMATSGQAGRVGRQFVHFARVGVWQYVILCGIVNTIAALLAWSYGAYHDGRFQASDAYGYCATLQFFSQSWAIWSMVQLLHHTRRELAPVRPVLKFMCIKMIIFFTWLQTVAIYWLENVSSLGRISLWIETEHRRSVSHWWDPFGWLDITYVEKRSVDAWQERAVRSRVGSGLGNLVLCLEMAAFAVLHCYAYPVSEWDPVKGRAGQHMVTLSCAGVEEPLLGQCHTPKEEPASRLQA